MDVNTRPLLILSLIFLLAACSQPKSVDTVFPERQALGKHCISNVIENEFLLQWEDGSTEVVWAPGGRQEVIDNWVKPNLPELRRVEYHQKIRTHYQGKIHRYSAHNQLDSRRGLGTPSTDRWGVERVRAPQVWEKGFKGQGVKVAVIDTAIDYTHPQLGPNILVNEVELNGTPGQDNDRNGFIGDVYGWDFYFNRPMEVPTYDDHGSHVAGIVAADPTRGRASGVAPEAKIIPISFMHQGEGSVQGAIRSINYAVLRGAQIINASWGGPDCSKILFDAIDALTARSILFVSASGNLGLDLNRFPDFPAAFVTPANLVVAASNPDDFLAGFSNTSFDFVHIGAPGDQILSTVPGGGHEVMSGTSMAAPMVAGAAALLLSARPQATLSALRAALVGSVDFKNYRVSSRGRLNTEAALNHLLAQ